MGKAKIIDEELWKSAGIDRKTGLPLKMLSTIDASLMQGTRILLRIKDEQQAVNRYKWEIPKGMNITSEELERFLYYRGQLCFFMMKYKEEKSYYITPFALEGTIDIYARFNRVHPVPFGAGMEYKDNPEADLSLKNLTLMLSERKLRVIKPNDNTEVEEKDLESVCVLLYDYTKQYSETLLPRQQIQEPIIELMSITIPYLRTNMLASTGVKGVRVADQDQYRQVIEGSRAVDKFAKNGCIWYPILGSVEMQELTEKQMADMQDYMQTLQSLDNLRLSFYGLENGGVFEKKAHTLGTEEKLNATNTDLVYDDGLSIRKKFCEIVNKVFKIKISVKENKKEAENMFSNKESSKMNNGGNEDGTNTDQQ